MDPDLAQSQFGLLTRRAFAYEKKLRSVSRKLRSVVSSNFRITVLVQLDKS